MESYLDILLYVITSKKLGVTVLYLKYNTVIPILIKEYLKLLNRLYDITWLGAVHYTYEKHKLFHIRVITKLPNSEQSYKGKVKTHKYINRQNQSTTGKL